MFTGIVSQIGQLTRKNQDQISIQSDMDLSDVRAGDSVAINGVCLTTLESEKLIFDISSETQKITNLKDLKLNSFVHLEKALKFSDRLGGHLVQGHIDGTGEICELSSLRGGLSKTSDAAISMHIKTSHNILNLCIPKGSIAINGVSLTINYLDQDQKKFSVCLVPHTLNNTLFSKLKIGNIVNLETDMIGKYIFRAIRALA